MHGAMENTFLHRNDCGKLVKADDRACQHCDMAIANILYIFGSLCDLFSSIDNPLTQYPPIFSLIL